MSGASIATELAARGWATSADFLPEDAIAALADEARARWLGGEFKAAGVGRGEKQALRADVRGDRIVWMNDEALTAALRHYRAAMEQLRLALNEELFAGLQEFEFHFAVFPPGTRYRRHVDRFSDADARVISTSLYLNANWQAADGGALRLHLAEGWLDVLPRAGTLVVFRSDTLPHEVLPAQRERFSLTGWFKRRALNHSAGTTAAGGRLSNPGSAGWSAS